MLALCHMISCLRLAVVLLASAWLFFFVTAIMIVLDYDILPIVFERMPLDILNNKYYLRGMSWQFANEDDLIYEVRIYHDDKLLRQTTAATNYH